MLFSNDQIASYVNQNFEPVWVAVRSVPIVRIDFGGGNVLTRTLHGNIATYVCNAEGTVLDIMPGIYEPKTYQSRLGQFVSLHTWFHATKTNSGDEKLRTYHSLRLLALTDGSALPARAPRVDVTKTIRIERPVTVLLQPPASTATETAAEGTPADLGSEKLNTLWKALAEDTRINETERRKMIHEYLSKSGLIRPDDITKWLYREVLHADLDDPYLGLGAALFANYPFEDR